MGNEAFAQLLNQHLNQADRSAAWLARRLGVSPSTVTRWLNGETRPESSSVVLKIATLLGVNSKAEQGLLLTSLDFELAGYLLGENEVTAPERAAIDAVDLTQTRIPNNLPVPLTKLIGRRKEIISLQQLLRGDYRLVTLTGPGGIGKTRLAQQLAIELLPYFPDGIFFVSLASINEPNRMLSAIAQTLEVKESGSKSLASILKDYLREKQMLLLLDNFEHLLQSAPLVADLLIHSPSLKILTTSRERLNLRGEQDFPISPLDTPIPEYRVSAKSLINYSAIETFVYYAQSTDIAFSLDELNAATVSEICTQLDGLPLAIELATVHIRTHSVYEINTLLKAAIGARFTTLDEGPRDLPARQQTLQAVMDWSYNLLNEAERTIFKRLSVFVNGFCFEAVTGICTSQDTLESNQTEDFLLKTLRSLHEKSLIIKRKEQNGDIRYGMLLTVREYSAVQLAETLEDHIVRLRFAKFYLDLARQAEPSMFATGETEWLKRLNIEYDNFQSVLYWCLHSLQHIDIALEIGFALWRYWEAYGLISDGRLWLERLLSSSPHLRSIVRANVLYAAGDLALTQSDYEKGRQLIQESLDLSVEFGTQAEIARSLNGLGRVAFYLGDYEAANQHFHDSIINFQSIGDISGEAKAYNNLAVIASVQGDYPKALKYYDHCLPLFRKKGDNSHIAYLVGNMAGVAFYQGDYNLAKMLYQEGYELQQELGDKWGISQTSFGLGRLAVVARDFELARHYLTETLQLQLQLQDKHEIADRLQVFAELALVELRFERSAVLLSAADHLRTSIGAPIIPVFQSAYEEVLNSLRDKLPEHDFHKSWLAGQMLGWQRAIEFALNEPQIASKSGQ